MVHQLKLCLYVLVLIYPAMAQVQRESSIKAVVHKALKSMARDCMNSVNATETDLEYVRKDPPFPEKASCIISCLLKKIGIIHEDKYSKKGFMMAVTPLLFLNSKKMDHMKNVSENCDNEYAPELHFKS
ncbi:unnamed protein product [Leptidea sinapis]|uniref:Uncharacterized protein n=1 Tax=Leptidea sinapis TaxID=189913 RepID=A0A5E4Q3V9_9NEOP|nr:unnamed protein product [Leptidea sinapis]